MGKCLGLTCLSTHIAYLYNFVCHTNHADLLTQRLDLWVAAIVAIPDPNTLRWFLHFILHPERDLRTTGGELLLGSCAARPFLFPGAQEQTFRFPPSISHLWYPGLDHNRRKRRRCFCRGRGCYDLCCYRLRNRRQSASIALIQFFAHARE